MEDQVTTSTAEATPHEERESSEVGEDESTVVVTEVPEIEPVPETRTEMHHRQSIMLHDSMVTVRLSEPPSLVVNTSVGHRQSEPDIQLPQQTEVQQEADESPRITMLDEEGKQFESPTGSESSRRGSDSSQESMEDGEGVNWEELQQTEDQEPRSESSDDSTVLLLARLEQENNLLATNPKSGIAKPAPVIETRQRGPRPPSIQHLKRLVNRPTPSALRYSVTPPPPMTDLEFYAALVQDYTRTAQCLPTLLSKKIRSGIPPPLRGVVWQSMSGARDSLLGDQFDRLCGESSPYEGIIGKDLGRSFPGVEMFRDPEGDGQRMMGRVLKCFSLYDHKIGYCQGLGFLVGPLLMHMGDKQAFCVLVRLMEHYDLRACFLPDLSGLHVRIYQFRQLLKQHIPNLSVHLDNLQIEPAYVSQWFLSFFAVTCPLPMLFRIYDVIFAEGASETIMRVALSLMQKNEEKIIACTELEDVMQLLLSRGLWDVYHYNADEFVNDFVGLTSIVTHECLHNLEMSYKEAQVADTVQPLENVGSAASRFLGRIWAVGNASTKSMNLSPGFIAPTRPMSLLRRTPSKQSLASTLNSIEAAGSESMLSSSTDATSVSRDSSNTDGSSIRTHSVSFNTISARSNKDKNLHTQIEDLLTALSEMQRDHAILATQLQREREEREEDRTAVRSLLDGLRKKTGADAVDGTASVHSLETLKPTQYDEFESDESTTEAADNTIVQEAETPVDTESTLRLPTEQDLSSLLENVETRFSDADNRRSSMLTTKSQLRDELGRAKEQLIIEVSKTQDFSRRLEEQKQEIKNLQEQVKEGHGHIRAAHTEKQRLERQIHELRMNGRKGSGGGPVAGTKTPDEEKSEWPTVRTSSGSSGPGGLRELRLGRVNSNKSKTPASFAKRSSSLTFGAVFSKENDAPPPPSVSVVEEDKENERERGKDEKDIDALVLELVQAKTAKAIAEQEAEEARGKLEAMRKLLSGSGVSPEGLAAANKSGMSLGKGHKSTPSGVSVHTTGLGSYFTKAEDKVPATAPPTTTTTMGISATSFWGGWGKRAVSGASN